MHAISCQFHYRRVTYVHILFLRQPFGYEGHTSLASCSHRCIRSFCGCYCRSNWTSDLVDCAFTLPGRHAVVVSIFETAVTDMVRHVFDHFSSIYADSRHSQLLLPIPFADPSLEVIVVKGVLARGKPQDDQNARRAH